MGPVVAIFFHKSKMELERAAQQLSNAFQAVEVELRNLEKSTDAAFSSVPGNLNPNVLESRLEDLICGASEVSEEVKKLQIEKSKVWEEIRVLLKANREKIVDIQGRLMMESEGYPDLASFKLVNRE
jgi:archaellum component FlaC